MWFPGVPLETLTVYQTAEHPDLEKNLRNYFTEQVNLALVTSREYRVFAAGRRCLSQGVPASVAFFSPSGVKFCLEVVRRLSGEQLPQIKVRLFYPRTLENSRQTASALLICSTSLQFAAIGPTTEEAMAAEGLRVSCTAEKPTAAHLAAAIAKALQ